MYNAIDYLSVNVDTQYFSNTTPYDNYNFLDTSAQNNIESPCQQSVYPQRFSLDHLADPMPQSLAREKYQCDGPIDRIQALLHDDPNQNAMQRLIDSLGLKDDLCDIRWNPSENMPIASDKEGEVNDQEKNHPLNSNDHEDAITTLGKQIISLQNGSTVYQVFNDNEPRRLRFPNARPQCGECGMVFGRRNCLVRHFINRQNRWSSMGYRLISSYRTLQPTDVSAFFAGDISNYWFRDFKDLDQKWRKLMKGCDLVDLNTIDIVDHHSLKCFLITMMTIMTKSNNGGGQSCHSKKQLLYHVGDKDHYLRVEFRNK